MLSWPRSSWLVLALLTTLSCSENEAASTPSTHPPAPSEPTDPTHPEPTAASPFEVGFAINHDGSQRVLRGWPLVVRISATLSSVSKEAYPLHDDTLSVRVRGGGGEAENWPWEAPPAEASARQLDSKTPTLEVVRLLDAAATTTLEEGPRTVEVRWGPATERFEITVENAPKNDDAGRALLRADEGLQRGDLDAALEALDEELDGDPSSVALLNQRALVLEQAGDIDNALVDAQAALAAFVDQYPDATEPPVTLLQLTGRLTRSTLSEVEAE